MLSRHTDKIGENRDINVVDELFNIMIVIRFIYDIIITNDENE